MRAALVAGIVALAVLLPSAQALDRRPVELSGLRPDGWGQSITNAQQNLRSRFGGIDSTYCTGVIMRGYRSDSSWIHARTRYWDKLGCAGRAGGTSFALVYDHKGRNANAWTIYRLHGASIGQLRG
jgi:hypothetical protein